MGANQFTRSGAALCPTVADLVRRSEIILSTVTSTVALAVAREAAPHLGEGHIYLDLNSTSPAVKSEIAGVITATGARFIEAAVMSIRAYRFMRTSLALSLHPASRWRFSEARLLWR